MRKITTRTPTSDLRRKGCKREREDRNSSKPSGLSGSDERDGVAEEKRKRMRRKRNLKSIGVGDADELVIESGHEECKRGRTNS